MYYFQFSHTTLDALDRLYTNDALNRLLSATGRKTAHVSQCLTNHQYEKEFISTCHAHFPYYAPLRHLYLSIRDCLSFMLSQTHREDMQRVHGFL
jgi:hypothetical protein